MSLSSSEEDIDNDDLLTKYNDLVVEFNNLKHKLKSFQKLLM